MKKSTIHGIRRFHFSHFVASHCLGRWRRKLLAVALPVIVATVISLPGNRWWGVRVALAASVTVNSTTDVDDGDTSSIADLIAQPGPDGMISLREAIEAADATPGQDAIRFDIPGTGVRTIDLVRALPVVRDPIVIDGSTQPGFTGMPLIELNGSAITDDGIVLRDGNSIVRGLIINGFGGNGILSTGQVGNNVIAGNYIGTSSAGRAAQRNTGSGILISGTSNNIIGGLLASDRNLISGNTQNGVQIDGNSATGNVIFGNYIGTDATGTVALPNQNGIEVDGPAPLIGSGVAGAGNLISGNLHAGVLILDSTSGEIRVQGNFIGTDVTGALPVPNQFGIVIGDEIDQIKNVSGCTIGVDGDGVLDATEGNVISGNLLDGVILLLRGTTFNIVAGNRIGTNAAGTAAVPNGRNGVVIRERSSGNIIGRHGTATSDVEERNVISGNAANGILISNSGTIDNLITGNFIGTNAAGSSSIPNQENGVLIDQDAENNTIGGTLAADSNVISGNGGNGVGVIGSGVIGQTTGGNLILGNSIFLNGALGIDLGGDGVTPNDPGDPDVGPNNFQNFPVITDARQGSTIIQFTLNSTPSSTFRIELFSSATPDPTVHGEGQTFIGSQIVMTDASGNFAGTFTSPTTITAGQVITATATDPDGNTSEFSQTRIVLAPTVVSFMGASAIRQGDSTVLEWRTGREVNNLGFNVYKEVAGKRSLATPEFVAGSALLASSTVDFTAGKPYVWIDKESSADTVYWIEDIDLNGTRTLHGPVLPRAGILRSRLANSARLNDLGKSSASQQTQREYPAAVNQQTDSQSRKLESAPTTKPSKQTGPKPVAEDLSVPDAARVVSPNIPGDKNVLKIAVTRDGWYRVQVGSLFADQGAGRGRYPRLSNGGVAVPIKRIKDEFIEFYGEGLDTPSTDARIYWLTWAAKPGLAIPEVLAGQSGQEGAGSFRETVERRDRTIYFSGLLNGEQENIFGPVIGASSPTAQTLTLKSIDSDQGATLQVTVQGVTNVSHLVRVQWNGVDIGFAEVAGQGDQTTSFDLTGSALRVGDNTITLQGVNGADDTTLVDRVRLTYSRRYQADENQLRFTVAAGQAVTVGGFNIAAVRVLDITDPLKARELLVNTTAGSDGDYSFTLPATAMARTLLAQTDLEALTTAPDRPSDWRGSDHKADLVIITHTEFQAAAERLADYRRQQRLRVEVVDIEDIFDEFSFGEHRPDAVRDFLQWTMTNWRRAPHYVLLVGDSSWDPRDYLGRGPADFVPTKLIDTTLMETASDDWLADFNQDGLPEMSLGRLPVRTAAEADAVVNKIIRYDATANEPERAAVFVADHGFESQSGDDRALVPPGQPVRVINRDAAPDDQIRSQILSGLNNGPRLVQYVGHGSVGVWTGAGLLLADDSEALRNGSRLPLMVLLTCLNGYSHDVFVDSLGEAMLLAPNGGAAAVWASTGMTEPQYQQEIAQHLYARLSTGQSFRIGDVLLEAKSATLNADVRRTWVLLGDPTMQFSWSGATRLAGKETQFVKATKQ